ncbi:uncharacterized protein LOC117181745 isoform X2 [Belonocnema kinseyi]|uniref:uncharacterized protein LOC117181745 isoform X2 n=1 Tax=Belonocnema kinseyi TaxID=2817044 RepID=UPI00143DAB22|nr:uncharacterized protein LOC117181745 isoform X2 [Belonocnema kinseyi]
MGKLSHACEKRKPNFEQKIHTLKAFLRPRTAIANIYAQNSIIAYIDADSFKSIDMMSDYAVKMEFGAAVMWTIDGNYCYGDSGEKFPLQKTLNRVLRNTY